MSRTVRNILKPGLPLIATAAFIIAGCATNSTSQTSRSAGNSSLMAENAKGSAQLWSENCARCHNSRSPSSYTDAEWEVAMHHMRIRANLTAEEHRKVLEFLKSAN